MSIALFREFSERINSMLLHMYKKHPTTAKKDYHTFSGVRTEQAQLPCTIIWLN
jgi:hypothetical protein